MRRLLAAVAALLVVFPADAAETAVPFPAVSHVALVARVDFAEKTLAARETLRLENRSGAPVKAVSLNLNRLMRYAGASDGAGPLRIHQQVVPFEDRPLLQVNHAEITLRRPLPPGSSLEIRIDYGGRLVGYTETGSLYIRDTIDESFTILRADAYAFPVVGTLSAGVNRAAPPPAFTFDAQVTVSSTHQVATGGRLAGTTVAGKETTYHFRSDAKVPFLNLAIAKYATLQRGGVRIYSFPEDAEGARRVAEKSEAAVKLLTSWFGPLAHEPEFTVIEIPEGMGSQAHLNAGIIQTAAAFRSAESLQELYHEVSHFWNVPDRDAPSPRWNEGLAMYLQRRIAARLDGRDETAERARRTAARLLEMAAPEPRLARVPMARYGNEQMTDFAYGVGFLMFYALEKRIGEDALLHSLHDYFQRFNASGAGFGEFMAVAAETSGQNLDRFFEVWFRTTQWLDALRAGRPVEGIGGPAL